MPLTDEQLIQLTDDAAEFIEELRADANPDEVDLVQNMEFTFAALTELQAWRATHPGERMEAVFFTDYGITRLQ